MELMAINELLMMWVYCDWYAICRDLSTSGKWWLFYSSSIL